MKKLSIWMLVVGLVLGIGFAAAACDPPICNTNLPLEAEIGVKLTVIERAELVFLDGTGMEVGYCTPGEALKGNNDLRYQGRSNTDVTVRFESAGFAPSIANDWIQYYVSFYPTWEWPMPVTLAWAGVTMDPGGEVTIGPGKGKWHGHIKAQGTWLLPDWETYEAGVYNDTIFVTVAKAPVS